MRARLWLSRRLERRKGGGLAGQTTIFVIILRSDLVMGRLEGRTIRFASKGWRDDAKNLLYSRWAPKIIVEDLCSCCCVLLTVSEQVLDPGRPSPNSDDQVKIELGEKILMTGSTTPYSSIKVESDENMVTTGGTRNQFLLRDGKNENQRVSNWRTKVSPRPKWLHTRHAFERVNKFGSGGAEIVRLYSR